VGQRAIKLTRHRAGSSLQPTQTVARKPFGQRGRDWLAWRARRSAWSKAEPRSLCRIVVPVYSIIQPALDPSLKAIVNPGERLDRKRCFSDRLTSTDFPDASLGGSTDRLQTFGLGIDRLACVVVRTILSRSLSGKHRERCRDSDVQVR
jgi:hypothetical protein